MKIGELCQGWRVHGNLGCEAGRPCNLIEDGWSFSIACGLNRTSNERKPNHEACVREASHDNGTTVQIDGQGSCPGRYPTVGEGTSLGTPELPAYKLVSLRLQVVSEALDLVAFLH